MSATTLAKIEKLGAEEKNLMKQKQRMTKQARKMNERYRAIEKRIHAIHCQVRVEQRRIQLEPLLNVPDAVQLAFRLPAAQKHAWLNDAKGTLIQLRLTRADVKFNGKEFSVPICDLQTAGETQGYTVAFGSGRENGAVYQVPRLKRYSQSVGKFAQVQSSNR
jgi:hypothetical protein